MEREERLKTVIPLKNKAVLSLKQFCVLLCGS